MFSLPWKKKQETEPTHSPRPGGGPLARFWERGFPWDPGFLWEESLFPRMDVTENRKKITVKAEIPGMEKDDIQVLVHGRTLTIRGETTEENREEDEHRFLRERRYGAFHRTVELPAEVDPEDVSATYKRGVLKVVLKKTRDSAPQRIQVRSG